MPNERVLPPNPEQSGWHWLDSAGVPIVREWRDGFWLYDITELRPERMFCIGYRYLRPCPSPSELDAQDREITTLADTVAEQARVIEELRAAHDRRREHARDLERLLIDEGCTVDELRAEIERLRARNREMQDAADGTSKGDVESLEHFHTLMDRNT